MLHLPRAARPFLVLAGLSASVTLVGNLVLGVTDPDPGKAQLRYFLSVGNHASNTVLALVGLWMATRLAGRQRRIVGLLSAGLLCYAIGNWTWLSYNLRGVDVPYPSIADAAYLLLPVLASIALAALLQWNGRRRQGIDLAIATLLPLTVLVFFSAFVIDPRLEGASGWRTLIDLAYPVLDATVIALAALLIYFAKPTPLTPGIRRVAASVTLLAVADVALITRAAEGTYFTGDWVDTLYVLASFSYGLSTLSMVALEPVARGGSAQPALVSSAGTRGPGLRVKIVVTLVLSLVLVDSLAYAVARRGFESSEAEALHESSDALLASMGIRIDERIEEWETDVTEHLNEATMGPSPPDARRVEEQLVTLRDHGLEGAVLLPAEGPAVYASAPHLTDEEAAMTALAAAAPAGASFAQGHVLVAKDSPSGDRLVAWADIERFDDILTAPEPVVILPADDPRVLAASEGGSIERHPLTVLPLVLEMHVDHEGAIAKAAVLARRSLLVSTIALAASGLLAIYVLRRTLDPLTRITEAAAKLGTSESDGPRMRLGIDTGDEVQVLAETLEASADALAQARERERAQAERLRRAEVDQAKLSAAVAIERREADHRRVLESLTDCVLVVDRAARILLANAAARTHGFRVGESASGSIEGEGATVLREHVARAALAAGPPIRLKTHGGCLLDAEARAIAYDEHDAVLIVAADVTDRVRLATEAEERRTALARSERLSSLGTLVAGVAHEINNPLTYINGNIELALLDLEGDPRSAETVARLQRALSGTERIAHITQALRAVARQKPAEAKEEVDLVGVVRNVEALLRAGLPSQVELAVVTSREDVRVIGSSTELHQVLLNLAKNAIEAIGDANGHVSIRCVPLDGEALLTVDDDGPGVPPEVAEQLFTPFFTTKPAGTGLGLSIAQGIVRDHGGRIELRSTPGKGATFRVHLPLAKAPSALMGPARAPAARTGP